jgi:peptide/nickel transport system substrate-binding protein
MLARRSMIIRSATLLAALLVGCAPNPTAAPATSPAEVVSPTEAVAPTDAPAAATEATTGSGPATDTVLNYASINNSVTPNFNPFTGVNALPPTVKGIFEPLMIYNTLKAEMVPWLADSYAWSDDYLSVTFKLHPGIKWSDGEDFTSEDVVFTFNLIKNTPGCKAQARRPWAALLTASRPPMPAPSCSRSRP